ncbi:MAG: hypothetical protein IJT44_04420 [Clostridia bacterium]|nr:hypothetical protein [Clostridia bacterium]
MSFADELRKKSAQAPEEERSEENRYLNEIYFSLKEGIVRCFLKKCYEQASRGETSYLMYLDFMHMIGIIHEQERIYVNQKDYTYVEHVLRVNKTDLHDFIVAEMEKNGFQNIKVKISASRFSGYLIRISVSW